MIKYYENIKNKRILITGGTGFVGSALIKLLNHDDNHFTILTRKKINNEEHITYISSLQEINENSEIDIIINLAGEPIDQRWTNEIKKKLLDSRVETTKQVISLIQKLKKKPELLISASAIGFYGANIDSKKNEALTENSPYNDNCFTHQLCKEWEEVANKASEYNTRVCIIRLGVVLGKNGGMIKKIALPFKLGLCGNLGNGEQYLSWVHISDVINAISYLIVNLKSKGVYNLTAPTPATNDEFTKAAGKALHRMTIFSVPSFMIGILFGEMGKELLLGSLNVIPQKISDEGFDFEFKSIDSALEDIF